ncbi:glycosyltransferase family 4 protein [Candidatus Babeliales bacterium]|nr:glycosyltransferase family 4 protein [Candidatus Babeliales bacterium]
MNKKKSLLYLRTDIMSEPLVAGGSVAHTLGVVQGFIKKGYMVACASSVMLDMLHECNLAQLKELQNPRWLSFLRWKLNCFLSTFIFTWQAWRMFKDRKYDVLYQRYSVLNATGVLLSRLKKIPLILEYNGSEVWIEKFWSRKATLQLLWLIRWIEQINLAQAQSIIVVSQVLKDELCERGVDPHKICVVPNGVDYEEFDSGKLTEQRACIRSTLNLTDKFVFGFIGTFSQWHGIELLADMIPRVVEKNPQTFFLLIGDGPLHPFLKTSLQKLGITNANVAFVGLVPQNSAKNYLAACDAFLSPTQPNADGSRFFGSPTKLFAYMSMSKPVLVSDLEQLKEIVSPALTIDKLNAINDKVVGIRIAPDSVEGFATAALWLAEHADSSVPHMGLHARARIEAHYGWNTHVSTIESFISKG